MARILMLTARHPFPMDDGWKIRTGSILRGLGDAGHEMHLLTLVGRDGGTPVADGSIARLEAVPRTRAYAVRDLVRGLVGRTPFLVLNYRETAYERAFDRLVGEHRYDVLLVEDVVMAQYALRSDVAVRVLDMHNIESHLLRRFADETRRPLQRLYARITAAKLERYEADAAGRFDAVLTCSAEDRRRLQAMGVGTPVHVAPNGVRTSFYDEVAASAPTEQALVFVASMDYHANISGVLHFVRTTLPLVLQSRPDLRFYIVGKNPPAEVRALASANVVVTGAVDDVRPYLERAAVVVVPLLVGGGTRLKILEAMASGRPVVSTPLGAEGIAADSGQIVLAGMPHDFAAAVLALLEDPERRQGIGRAGRAFASGRYDWSVITAGIDRILADLRRAGAAA